jgi:ELWxxDGT repeat protein
MRFTLFPGRLKLFFGETKTPATRKTRRFPPPQLEALETRLMPSGLPHLLKDVNAITHNSSPSGFVQINAKTILFAADDGVHGTELFATDGTPAGTFLVKDINPGMQGSSPNDLTNVNGTLFFSATDGTASGTVVVKQSDPLLGRFYPSAPSLANVNGTLFFVADDGTHGVELWNSNGTAAGTAIVKDIDPERHNSYPGDLTNINGTLFFSADDGVHGFEPWRSNGTANGTNLVKDINATTYSSYARYFRNVNGVVFFTADDGVHGRQLWSTNGTAAGTALVADINPEGLASFAFNLTNVNGTLFFSAFDGTNGSELWRSDGTAAGTTALDINPDNIDGADPSYLTNVNGALFFAANDTVHGRELWKSNGTQAGTVLVKDINTNTSYLAGDSFPYHLTNVNGTLFFTANDGTHGDELWRSDGTAAGTVMVRDINPGNASSSPSNLTNVNGTLFFTAVDGASGDQLWESNGTSAGTVLVKDINPGNSYQAPGNLTNVNGTLFFSADDGAHGRQLWRSNGATAGTVMLTDINAGFNYPFGTIPEDLTNVSGTLFFDANDVTHGRELWKSDGTAAGTVLVKDITPGANGSYPRYFANVNGVLFFSADDVTHGSQLWQSNGSTAGTVMVSMINPNPVPIGARPSFLTNVNGTLFFTANDGFHGAEPWVLSPAAPAVRVTSSPNLRVWPGRHVHGRGHGQWKSDRPHRPGGFHGGHKRPDARRRDAQWLWDGDLLHFQPVRRHAHHYRNVWRRQQFQPQQRQRLRFPAGRLQELHHGDVERQSHRQPDARPGRHVPGRGDVGRGRAAQRLRYLQGRNQSDRHVLGRYSRQGDPDHEHALGERQSPHDHGILRRQRQLHPEHIQQPGLYDHCRFQRRCYGAADDEPTSEQ